MCPGRASFPLLPAKRMEKLAAGGGGKSRKHHRRRSGYAQVRKSYFEACSKPRKVRGSRRHSSPPPAVPFKYPQSPRVASARSPLWVPRVSRRRASFSPGAKGRAQRAPWAEVGRGRGEERWGRFRRLCNLTHWLRLHGSDEQAVLLPKLISPAPSLLLSSPPPPPAGPAGLDLFIYSNSPGWGAWCGAAAAPSHRPPSGLSPRLGLL